VKKKKKGGGKKKREEEEKPNRRSGIKLAINSTNKREERSVP